MSPWNYHSGRLRSRETVTALTLQSRDIMANLALGLTILLCGVCGTLEVEIINCNNNKVEIFEDSPAPVTCGDITSTADVVWRGDGVNIGECSADGTCNSDLYNDYNLSRSWQSTESQLTLVPDYRRHAGVTVTCQDRESGSTDSCTLVIRRHSELSECHVTTNTVDGTVSGSCRVQQAFSSDNIYSCSWTLNDEQAIGGFENNREKCSFTNQPLPQEEGLYVFTILVVPPPAIGFFSTVRKGLTSSPESSDSIKGIVAGAVTTVICFLILIAVIYTKRLKSRCQGPVYETAVLPAGDAHTYTGLQAGDNINNVFNTLHHPCEGVVGFTVYENQGHEV